MTYEELWITYAANGGGASPEEFMAFVIGASKLPSLEACIVHHVIAEELTLRASSGPDDD